MATRGGGAWPKWAKKRHARDFTARDTVLDELRKKEHHGASLIRRALKKAKTFDEAKLKRRLRAPEDASRLETALHATKNVDIDVLAKQCARACAARVEESLDTAFGARDEAAADESADASRATRAVDLGDGFDSGDVLRGICDDAASAGASDAVVDVVGENAYVAAARRLLRAQATRTETDALKERLLAIAGRMNRAVVGKKKREEWAKEKEAREAKRAEVKAKAEEKARRRAAGEEVSSSEDEEDARDGGGRGRESESESESESEGDVDEEGYASLSEETMAELRAAKREAKRAQKKKGKKSSRGGDEDEDVEELDLGPKKKKVKKRMGQRKRRQIAEAKFGANAAHLIAERERARQERQAKEEEERNMHPSWQAKRKQAPLIIQGAKGKKVKFGEEGVGASAKPSVSKKPQKQYKPKTDAPEAPLHPSWQAKLKADAQAWGGGGVKPEGKKVVFD